MSESQPTYPAPPLAPEDERLWSTLAHVGNVVGPVPSLLILLILGPRSPRSPRVRRESTEALNFSVTAVIAWVALSIVSAFVGALAGAAPFGVGALLGLLTLLVGLAQFAVWVLVVVFSIVAAVRVNSGGSYRYPLSLRLIKERKDPS